MNKHLLAAVAFAFGATAYAAEPLTLSFQRSGTALANVAVTANIDGVTASLTSLSHAIKNVTNTIICADVNGSSSPTIVYTFAINGLPQDWTFNNVGLDIHALNGSGGNQQSNDNKPRQFNVSVSSGDATLVSYTNLDPAMGIEGVRKVWDAATAETITPADPYILTITVTKGAENQGCFFGLEGITLSTVEAQNPEPPTPPTGSKIYTIKWKNNTQSYMSEQRNGNVVITGYNVNNKIFWEFIPTENQNCYYVRNTASGRYLGSCNMEPSSASRILMSDTPVEYYIHLSAATSGENQGCYWFSSTDCANYDNEGAQARCLNKDGASTFVITWTTSVANTGSYWTLVESEDLYEPLPVIPIHTPYALSHRIYQLPCGSIGDTWISKVNSGSDFYYPMADKNMNVSAINAKPSSYYNILTRDAITVYPGVEAALHIELNKAPAEGTQLFLYVDFDRDGLFEYSQELTCTQSLDATFPIAEDAQPGSTRMRMRLTNNKLTDADDDVVGEVLDLLLNVTEPSSEGIAPEVAVNDPMRGDAVWENGTAIATPKGSSMFLYWAEGLRFASTDSQFSISASASPRKFTAYFTVNTGELDGIDCILLNTVDGNTKITFDGEVISTEGNAATAILLYQMNGLCAARSNTGILNVSSLPGGIYIAKAITAKGTVSAKIRI